MIAIVDYGMGNLRSVEKALAALGHEALVTSRPEDIDSAGGVILPGVGAFAGCMENLAASGLVDSVRSAGLSGRPFLGICLGMQLLFSFGEEGRGSRGLDLLKGRVRKLYGNGARGNGPALKIPHMGWNRLILRGDAPLLKGIAGDSYVYFVHSYVVEPEDPDVVIATTDYGETVPAAVRRGNLMGVQFHPEKSSALGLRILKNFAEMTQR